MLKAALTYKTKTPKTPALWGLVKKIMLKKEAKVKIVAKNKANNWAFSPPVNII